MRQLFQNLRSGEVRLIELPAAAPRSGAVVIRTSRTVISPGTERMLAEFGKAGWLSKAMKHPDKVRQVVQKIKTDGLEPTIAAVFNKLDEPLPLGYCNAGTVVAVGEGVTTLAVGDRVASNGGHAEYVLVPENLCARIPAEVTDEEAAFAVLGAIALQGVRLLVPQLGERYAVMGLGLLGLLTVQILRSSGCEVIAFDYNEGRVQLARGFGAEAHLLGGEGNPVASALAFSGGHGVDGVVITAATESRDPIRQAPQMCRKRGKVVLVGVVGLELDRSDFYQKEISFQVSCSYGPGRYDSAYEQRGLDYPIGFVRWTEQRNIEAVLGLLRDKKLLVSPLISTRIQFNQAETRYEPLLSDGSQLGVVFEYEGELHSYQRTIRREAELSPTSAPVGVSFIGMGSFARSVLLPHFLEQKVTLRGMATVAGTTGAAVFEKQPFVFNTTDSAEIFSDEQSSVVVIATRHDSHAEHVIAALNARKHVFVEKPLALTRSDLQTIEDIFLTNHTSLLAVGFNRRFSPFAEKIKELLRNRSEPLAMTMTVNAGAIDAKSWVQDEGSGGGRLIGEACHFIDLFAALAGSPIASVYTVAHPDTEASRRDDRAIITLTFVDGSIGTIQYFANGHKSLAKERLEIFSEGRVLVVDNFREMHAHGFKGFRGAKLKTQDKGHAAEIKAFVRSVTTGEPFLLSREEILSVSRASIAAVESLRQKMPIIFPVASAG